MDRIDALRQAISTTRELIELEHQKIDTLGQLLKVLLIADLAGVAPKDIEGSVYTRVSEGHSQLRPWRDAALHIRVNGVEHTIPMLDVPAELWPSEMRHRYNIHVKSQQRRRQTITH